VEFLEKLVSSFKLILKKMIEKILNLGIVFVLGLTYVFTYSKIIKYSFIKMNIINNTASLILLISSLVASGINLFHISELSSSSFSFFYQRNLFSKGIIYYFGYFITMWVFSFFFFRLSFLITGFFTPEDEKIELGKNNIELACLHSVILLILTVVITPALIAFASQFIPYPDMPF
jgi:hypothetical protein